MSTVSEDILSRIEIALDGLRPYLEADGGDIRIVGVKGDVLEIELLGACSSCAMSPMTLKAGVEEAVIKAVPEIKSIVAVDLSELSE
jgi:Fe-S cluster biogenesis protein NfuA